MSKVRTKKRHDHAEDLALVRSWIAEIEQLPETPERMPGVQINVIREPLFRRLESEKDRLILLQGQWARPDSMPRACCGQVWGSHHAGHPVENVVHCPHLCSRCRVDALTALKQLERALAEGRCLGPWLLPNIEAERRAEARLLHQEHLRQRQRTREQMRELTERLLARAKRPETSTVAEADDPTPFLSRRDGGKAFNKPPTEFIESVMAVVPEPGTHVTRADILQAIDRPEGGQANSWLSWMAREENGLLKSSNRGYCRRHSRSP